LKYETNVLHEADRAIIVAPYCVTTAMVVHVQCSKLQLQFNCNVKVYKHTRNTQLTSKPRNFLTIWVHWSFPFVENLDKP